MKTSPPAAVYSNIKYPQRCADFISFHHSLSNQVPLGMGWYSARYPTPLNSIL